MSAQIQLQHEFYDRLMESQYQPAERRLDRQRGNLERLLKHAKAHVPFYASRLDAVFSPSGEIRWERWDELPILKRNDLLTCRESMQSQSLPAYQGRVARSMTSGSSGEPITVSASSYSKIALSASVFRAQRWHGFDWSRNFLTWGGLDATSPMDDEKPAGDVNWGPGWLKESTGKARYLAGTTRPQDVLRAIDAGGVSYLGTRPRRAQQLADEAKRLGMDVKLDAILGFGTAAFPDVRDDCEAAFGARIVSPYSSKEGHLMAFQCPTGPHFHINEETTLIEIVDDVGNACPPGVTGRVLVTSLFNLAQPVIRYDQGDLASFGPDCSCGRTLRVLDAIAGRVTHLFRFPDGSRVSPSLPRDFGQVLGAKYWQVAQIGPLHLEVRYVPAERQANRHGAAVVIRERINPAAEVSFLERPDLVRDASGKYLEFVCELSA